MSAQQHLQVDFYKVPRESVDVEALAQEHFYYLKTCAEDAEHLNLDAAKRDQCIAEFNTHPGAKPSLLDAETYVPFGERPEVHLDPAKAKIMELTPPKSFEDRVVRLHVASSALMVFSQYKLHLALLDHRDLRRDVRTRTDELMDKWLKTQLLPLLPGRSQDDSSPTTPPTQPHAPQPNDQVSPAPAPAPALNTDQPYLSEEVVKAFVKYPHTVIGKKFVHCPPPGAYDGDTEGMWQAISFRTRVVDGEIDHEYEVLVETSMDDPIPFGADHVEELLRFSKPL